MEIADSFDLIKGKIISGYVRTEFLLSDISYRLGIVKESKLHFFANPRTNKKIKNLKDEFYNSDIKNKDLYIKILNRFDKIRIERNNLTHSIFLSDINDRKNIISFNYRTGKEGLINEIGQYRFSDFEDLNKKIISLHNDLYLLYFES